MSSGNFGSDGNLKFTRRQKEYDSQRATQSPRARDTKGYSERDWRARISNESMPSSKGEPTDPELRERIKEEVKNEEKGAYESQSSFV